jgi:CheY-like chemotaxis protein
VKQSRAQGKRAKRILVIEDEPVITRICIRVLTAYGFEVDTAASGDIARNMVRKKDYDLCLTDIRLPKMNGIEFYRYLESEHKPLADRVIFTTGDILSEEIKNFLAGVNRPFLPKPFTPEELIKIIKKSAK